VQSDWLQDDDEADDYIKNKPTIPTIPDAVQSDWLQDDDEADDYIKNKPTIPTIPDAQDDEFEFTFVIDSDAKLAMWAANDEDNDYSVVLIKKGTHVSSSAVNLTTTGTKIVVGQKGSLLSFDSQEGLKYDSVIDDGTCFMRGVNVKVSYSGSGDNVECSAYANCANLTNCTADAWVVANGDDGYTFGAAFGFSGCKSLYRCFCVAGGDYVDAGNSGGASGLCYVECENLVLCTGKAAPATSDSSGVFVQCERLYGCRALESPAINDYGYYGCNYLYSCVSNVTGTGFCNCRILYGCNSAGGGAPYADCYMRLEGYYQSVDGWAEGGSNFPCAKNNRGEYVVNSVTQTWSSLNSNIQSQVFDIVNVTQTVSTAGLKIASINEATKWGITLVTIFNLDENQTLHIAPQFTYKLIEGASLSLTGAGVYVMTVLTIPDAPIINIAKYNTERYEL
jgi:hypothetical protein